MRGNVRNSSIVLGVPINRSAHGNNKATVLSSRQQVRERPFTYCEEVSDNTNACELRLRDLMRRHTANLDDLEALQNEVRYASRLIEV